MEDLISIIVPIYNVQKYIKKCVQSLIDQDYTNIEIILVDDGSPDLSKEIIDEIAKHDNRVMCVHKNNGGVSSARNAGLERASGKYVTFVDGDDWVDNNYVSHLYTIAKEYDADIVMNENNYGLRKKDKDNFSTTISVNDAMKKIYYGDIFVAVWNKMYKRKIIVENSMTFDEKIWYGEGMLFNMQFLNLCQTVAVCCMSLYHQTFNPSSAMRNFKIKNNLCGIKSLELQKKYINSQDVLKAWKYHRYCFNLTIFNGIVQTNTKKDNLNLYKTCLRNIRKGFLIPLKAEISLRTKTIWIITIIFPRLMARRSKIINKKRSLKNYTL